MAKKNAPSFKPKLPVGVLTPDENLEENTIIEEDNTETNDITQESDAEVEDVTLEDTTLEEDTLETETETEDSTADVMLVQDTTPTAIPDQNVKIRVSRDYSCSVGGQRYFFEKGKIHTVPKNVKTVLSKEDNLLKPL